MVIPKVKFEVGALDDYFKIFREFFAIESGEMDWSEVVYQCYPGLKEGLIKIKNKKERQEFEYQFFAQVFRDKERQIYEKTELFQQEWDVINNKIMLVLADMVEHDWSLKDEKIIARVTLNPICPRYINERMFDVFYGMDVDTMKSISIHELLHFIYFEKWKEVFPGTDVREFESPYLIWKLSEMMTGVILNDTRLQKVFKHEFRTYDEFENLQLGDQSLITMIDEIYHERDDFADFLHKSWSLVKENEKELVD